MTIKIPLLCDFVDFLRYTVQVPLSVIQIQHPVRRGGDSLTENFAQC